MALKAEFSDNDIKRRFIAMLEVFEELQIEAMMQLGEICVTHARNLPPEVGFHDRTGNLRSSIGYVVYKDGVITRDNYVAVKGMESGQKGVKKGRELADNVAKENDKGLLLVVTAGMEYAMYLEAGGAYKLKSKRSYDVLSSAQIMAQREAPRMINELMKNLKAV